MQKRFAYLAVLLMLGSGFALLGGSGTSNAAVPSGGNPTGPYYGFTNYTQNIGSQTYSLPNYSYTQFNSYESRSSQVFGNAPILTRNNVFHQAGFVYLNTNNQLVFYGLNSAHTTVLSDATVGVTGLHTFAILNSASYSFYGLRTYLHYYQLPNGSLYDVWTFGQNGTGGGGVISVYYFYNSTVYNIYGNSGIPPGDGSGFGMTTPYSVYQINRNVWIYNANNSVITGEDYIIDFNYTHWTNSTGSGNPYMYESFYTIVNGLGISDSAHNSAFGTTYGMEWMMHWTGTTTMNYYSFLFNETTKTISWANLTFSNPSQNSGYNNGPWIQDPQANGTILFYEFAFINGGTGSPQVGNAALIYTYWNPATNAYSGSNEIAFNNTIMGYTELYSNDPYLSLSGFYPNVEYNATQSGYPPRIGSTFINYLNYTRYLSTNASLNANLTYPNTSTGWMQQADASTNSYESYIYEQPTSNTVSSQKVIVYWNEKYTSQYFAYGLSTYFNTTTAGPVNNTTGEPSYNGTQLPFGTYTLPQFSPFNTFNYTNSNVSVAWNNLTKPDSLTVKVDQASTYNFLSAFFPALDSGSEYINGSMQFSTLNAGSNPYVAINTKGIQGDNPVIFMRPDQSLNTPNKSYNLLYPNTAEWVNYSLLLNAYNNTLISNFDYGSVSNTYFDTLSGMTYTNQLQMYLAMESASGPSYVNLTVPTITEKTYPVYFNNPLWSSGQSWSVSINGFNYQSTTNQIEVNLTTGSYNYTSLIANTVFSASSNVNITGNISAYYVNVPFQTGKAFYLTVNVNGYSGLFNFYLSGYKYTISSGQSIYPITNGSYSYTADFGPSYRQDSGTVVISGNTTLTLTATIQTYHYKFTSNFAGFHINIADYGNTSESGTVLYLNISNYNTTFTAYYQLYFSVSYSPSQNIGDTLYQNFTITFTAIAHYTYYIYETGLVLGSPFSTTNTWSINWNGTVYSSSVNYIEITTTSTSITFLVYGVDGYSVNHRIITVAETGNTTIYSDLNFTQNTNTTPYSIGLLWSYFPYIFTTILVAAIFIPIGLVVRRARRKDR